MNKDEIKQRVRLVLARTLKVNPDTITDTASQTELSRWDSVYHMNVVLALENEFGIEFADAELPKLTSFPLLIETVARHTGEGS